MVEKEITQCGDIPAFPLSHMRGNGNGIILIVRPISFDSLTCPVRLRGPCLRPRLGQVGFRPWR